MARRNRAPLRPVLPDPRFQSRLVTSFTNAYSLRFPPRRRLQSRRRRACVPLAPRSVPLPPSMQPHGRHV